VGRSGGSGRTFCEGVRGRVLVVVVVVVVMLLLSWGGVGCEVVGGFCRCLRLSLGRVLVLLDMTISKVRTTVEGGGGLGVVRLWSSGLKKGK
jgi:hypothetical protein